MQKSPFSSASLYSASASFALVVKGFSQRTGKFKNGKEDLKKSDWYMKKYKELKEKKESSAPTITINTPSYPLTTPLKDIDITCKPYLSPTLAPSGWDNITTAYNKNN